MSKLDDFRIKAKAEGYNDDEINTFVQEKNQVALNEGYSMDEINGHWGIGKPDPVKEQKLIQDYGASLPKPEEGKEEILSNEINTFEDVYKHISSGLAHSSMGLLIHGKPMTKAPQNPSLFASTLYGAAGVVGDIPAMAVGALAGGIGGGAAGMGVAAVPGAFLGATAGIGAGAFGLPSAMKAYMMDGYENGSFKDFNDFYSRMSSVMLTTAKSATVGVATEMTAGLINPYTAKMAEKFASPVAKLVADELAKVSMMTAAGSAVEGEMPSANDFVHSFTLVGALHSIGVVKRGVMKTFIDKDIHPNQVALDSETNQTIKQDLHATNKDIPDAYNQRPVDKVATESLGKPLDPMFTEEEIRSQPPEVKIGKDLEAGYQYTPMDTTQPTEGKTFYHGTKSGLADISQSNGGYTSVEGLYGPGIYLTDNPDVAKSYSENKGRGAPGKVLAGQLKNLNLLDLEKPMDDKVREIFNKHLGYLDAGKLGAGAKGKFGIEQFKEAMAENGYTHSDAIEAYQNLQFDLREGAGYDGLRHEGGGRHKSKNLGPHNVAIIFDPEGNSIENKITPVEHKEKPTESKPTEEKSFEESIQAIQANIVTKGGETVAQRLKTAKDYFVDSIDNLYTRVVDKYNPIKDAVKQLSQGKDVAAVFDAYKLSRNANDGKAKALYAFKYGTFDYFTMKRNGEGLNESLSGIKKEEMRSFDAFLAANRTIELDARGVKDPGFDIGESKNAVAKAPAHFVEAAKKVTEYRNRNLDYLVQAGLLEKDVAQKFKDDNKLYVPFNRILDINNEAAIAAKKGNKTFKPLEGANDLKTQSPLQAISNDTATFIQLAEANRARIEMVKMQEATSGKDPLMYKVKTPGKVEMTPEAAEFLNAHGYTTESGDAFQFTRRNADLKENQFEVYRDGQREVWETKDVELAKALKAVDGEPGVRSLIVKVASAISSTIRATTAVTPDFVVRNFFSDQISAQILSKHGGAQLPHTFKALGDLMGKDHSVAWQEFLKSGGASGAFLKLNDEYFNKEIYKLQEETGFMDATWNVMKSPFKMMEAISSTLEQSTRLAEFKRTTQGDYSINKLFEGGFNAREVTVDFQRMGSATSVLNSITAFQNAGIQGFDRSVRAFNENKGKFAATAGAFITVPTILNYVVNKDDPRYKDAPSWQRDLYWVVPTDDWVKPDPNDDISKLPSYLVRMGEDGMPMVNRGITYRVPKPREVGMVFGSFVERSLDAFFEKNPDAYKGFAGSILDTVTPSVLPDVFTPIVETWANKNMFTGDAIVPHSSERLLPADRFTEYTSELAKKVSTILTTYVPGLEHNAYVAPAVIDNWIGDWTGNMGRYILSGIDYGLKDNAPEKAFGDIPFIKAFVVRNPSMGGGVMQEFNDRVKDIREYQASIKKLSKSQDPNDRERMVELQQKLIKNYPDHQRILNASSAMQNMREFVHNVYRTTKMNKHEKRQAIDGTYYQMIEMARGTKKSTLQGDEESEE